MILDSSAIVAILRDEPERAGFNRQIEAAPVVRVSAATMLESCVVAGPNRHEDVDQLIEGAHGLVMPFDWPQSVVAREAYARYGKGSRSPARLNLGDCFAYALAKVTGEALLFKGDGFTHTDITPAITPAR